MSRSQRVKLTDQGINIKLNVNFSTDGMETIKELTFPEPEGMPWGRVTHMGLFARRPWWQRVLGIFYRPWRRDRMIWHEAETSGGSDE